MISERRQPRSRCSCALQTCRDWLFPMTNQELIDALSELPPDLPAKMFRTESDSQDWDEYNVYEDIGFVSLSTDDKSQPCVILYN